MTPFTFTCPHCQAKHTLPIEKIPESGAWGKCNECGNRIYVTRRGAYLSPPIAPVVSQDGTEDEAFEIIRQGKEQTIPDESAPASGIPAPGSDPQIPEGLVTQGENLDEFYAKSPVARVEDAPDVVERKEGEFTFICPLCHTVHTIPEGSVPSDGGWGTCNRCNGRIYLTSEGAFAEKPVPADIPRELYLRLPTGEVIAIGEEALKTRIKACRVTPFDQLSRDGERFTPIGDWETFSPLFKHFTLTSSRYCVNHTDKVAVHRCRTCLRGYCGACGEEKHVAMSTLFLCPACQAPLEKADLKWMEKPFYRDLNRVILFPLKEMAWVTALGVGLLMWMGKVVIPFTLPLYFIGLAFIIHAIAASANGKKVLTTPDFSDPMDLIGRGIAGLVVSIAVFLPIFLLNMFVLVGLLTHGFLGYLFLLVFNIPLAILAFLYYPMALGLVAVWDNKWLAFRVDLVLAHVMKIKMDYLAILAAFFIILIVDFILSFFLHVFPLIGGIIAGMAHGYFALVQAHILGWTLYMDEEKLGWS